MKSAACLLEQCVKLKKYQAFNRAAGIDNPNASAVLRETRLMLRKVVKRAKQKYYQKVIDGLVEA